MGADDAVDPGDVLRMGAVDGSSRLGQGHLKGGVARVGLSAGYRRDGAARPRQPPGRSFSSLARRRGDLRNRAIGGSAQQLTQDMTGCKVEWIRSVA